MDTTLHKVSRGFQYNYIHIRPSSPSQAYILFLHGWPSLAHEWHHQITYFARLGFGIIAPDLLGYGSTSRPSDVSAYSLKPMSRDIIDILNHENVKQVHGVGHDWGVVFLCRLAVYFPERFSDLCFLANGYQAFGQIMDVDAVNRMTAEGVGYSCFGYIKWFNEAPDAGEVINQHQDSIVSLVYPEDAAQWKYHLGPVGSLEKWLKNDSKTTVGSYLTEDDRRVRDDSFGRDGGYEPTLNWYRAVSRHINYRDEKDMAESQSILHHRVLLLTCAKDPISLAEMHTQGTKPFVPDLKVNMLDTGHWPQLEAPEEVNAALRDFWEAK